MKVLYQWTQGVPGDWLEVESADWPALPERPLPSTSELGGADNNPGWIHRLNCQGVSFIGDHYAVEDIPGGCRITAWWDDLDSYPDGQWYARVMTFLDPAPDTVTGLMNTRQSQVIYAQPDALATFAAAYHVAVADLDTAVENCVFRPWADFVPPPTSAVRHGIWTSDELNVGHEQALSTRGWREWVPPA
jgi:hypothetical protein